MIQDLKEKIREIDHRMTDLREERKTMEDALIEEQKKKLQAAVGLCFRLDSGEYARIIGVPQEKLYKVGRDFNEYQLPALVIKPNGPCPREKFEEDIRIEEATLFSKAVYSDDVVAKLKEEYHSITPEEFNAALEREFDAIRNLGTESP